MLVFVLALTSVPPRAPAADAERAGAILGFGFFRLRFGGTLARRFGGRRLVGGLEHHKPRREYAAAVLIEVDDGVVLVDFDQSPWSVGGLHHPIAFGPRFHRSPMFAGAPPQRFRLRAVAARCGARYSRGAYARTGRGR